MFPVAYKRFVDHIPMAIDYELVRGGEVDVFFISYGLSWNLMAKMRMRNAEIMHKKQPK